MRMNGVTPSIRCSLHQQPALAILQTICPIQARPHTAPTANPPPTPPPSSADLALNLAFQLSRGPRFVIDGHLQNERISGLQHSAAGAERLAQAISTAAEVMKGHRAWPLYMHPNARQLRPDEPCPSASYPAHPCACTPTTPAREPYTHPYEQVFLPPQPLHKPPICDRSRPTGNLTLICTMQCFPSDQFLLSHIHQMLEADPCYAWLS